MRTFRFCFWHKFTLTEKSRVYGEWKNGLHKELKPVKTDDGLHFENEEKSKKYGQALDSAVNAWMHGKNIETNVKKWFDFSVPEPQIPKNYIEKSIEKYELAKEKAFSKQITTEDLEKLYWIGSKPILQNNKIIWFYKQECEEEKLPKDLQNSASDIINLFDFLSAENASKRDSKKLISDFANKEKLLNFLKYFRGRGLVKLP